MTLTAEVIRQYATKEDVVSVAIAVRNKSCVCCPGTFFKSILLTCGHYLCEYCLDHEHVCLACALIT